MFSIFEISASAMLAQSQRLNVTASNMANAESVAGPNDEPYKAKHVMFESLAQKETGVGGVKVTEVVESKAPPRLEYDPTHPAANDDGYVALPSVNPVEEMVNMISASRNYQSNVKVMETSRQLMMETLRIGQS